MKIGCETLKAIRAAAICGHWGAMRNVAVGSCFRRYVLRRLVCLRLIFVVDIYHGGMRLCLYWGDYEVGENAR